MTKEEAIATRNHREFIQHPDWWPHFGILPVKRRADKAERREDNATWCLSISPVFGTQVGVIVSCDVLEVRIGVIGITNFSEPSTPRLKYESIDALIADGWEVD